MLNGKYWNKILSIRSLLILMAALFHLPGQTEISCADLLPKQASLDWATLPEIKFIRGEAWFTEQSTALEEPPNTKKYSQPGLAADGYAITYFFNIQSRRMFVQRRGGLSDTALWYGPIPISDDLSKCIRKL